MWKPIRSEMASTDSGVVSRSSRPRRSHSLTSQSTTVILNRRYRCILTNLEERTLLDLLPGRQQDAVIKRLMNMTDRHNVEIVSMDMWKPYRRAVQAALPQARIVVDKFHVVRMANEALEKDCKGLRKELKANQRRTLKGDRRILLKRAHDVSDRERLIMETWTGAFPQLLVAYEHKERFNHIWDSISRCDAEKTASCLD